MKMNFNFDELIRLSAGFRSTYAGLTNQNIVTSFDTDSTVALGIITYSKGPWVTI